MDEIHAANRRRLNAARVRNDNDGRTSRRPKSTKLYRQVEIICLGRWFV